MHTDTKFFSGETKTETEKPNISIRPRKPASLYPHTIGRTAIKIPATKTVKIEYFVEKKIFGGCKLIISSGINSKKHVHIKFIGIQNQTNFSNY